MSKPVVYALVGEDSFLQLQKLTEIMAGLDRGVQRIDVDGERAELAEVLDELRSFAMFGPSKLVAVRDADAFVTRFREPLENYLDSPSSTATLVLRMSSLPKTQRIYKMIAKIGRIEACEPLKQHELPGWLTARAKSMHKLNLSREAAVLMAEQVGADLGKLDNELAKLALQVEAGKQVGPEDVRKSVAFQREQEIFEMTNALALGNTADALRRWRQLLALDSSAEFRAVTWLGMWLEDVRAFLASPSTFKNVWRYKEKLPQFKQTAQAIGKKRVAKLVDMLAEVDYRSKNGIGEASSNVEQFLLAVGAD
jgi:DNA polymerase-3 subunit delta